MVVDHDMGRRVGVVLELVEYEDFDGPYVFARTRIEAAPGWLSKRTRASLAYIPLREQTFGGLARLLRGLVTEVSVLSPSREPREPRAGVVLLRDAESPRASPACGEIIRAPGTLLRRPASAGSALR